jgi:hypothetical protein
VVVVKLRKGALYTHRIDKAKGTPEVPLCREERIAKFRECAQIVISVDKIEQAIQLLEDLEDIPDITELMALLA